MPVFLHHDYWKIQKERAPKLPVYGGSLPSCLFSAASCVGEGQATGQRMVLMCYFSKQVLEAGVSMHPGLVSSQTIPEVHPDTPGRTFVSSASLESVGSVQASVGPVGLCFQSCTF